MNAAQDRLICMSMARESKRKRDRTAEEKTDWGTGERREKDKNQHNSFPLISSMHNIKAITGCLCQRIWNNTLVSAQEMR